VRIIGVIPARLASTRLPRKPLHLILDKPLIQWVYEGASGYPFDKLVVATDSELIQGVVKECGGEAIMTGLDHSSGTSRMYEVAGHYELDKNDIVVNIQGDEPLVNTKVLNALLNTGFKNNHDIGVSTVAREFISEDEKKSPHNVKALVDKNGFALDFTRNWNPTWGSKKVLCHIGLYAYKKWALDKFISMPPTEREKEERLEQLRFVENLSIFHVAVTQEKLISVDTLHDAQAVENELKRQ